MTLLDRGEEIENLKKEKEKDVPDREKRGKLRKVRYMEGGWTVTGLRIWEMCQGMTGRALKQISNPKSIL